jgi:diguanylate cyclase (GGDEF)-like protein/PAS domain S-box-containing protein
MMMRAVGATKPAASAGHGQSSSSRKAERVSQLDHLLSQQSSILGLLLSGPDEEALFTGLTRLIEAAVPGVRCAVSIPHHDGTTRTFAGGEPAGNTTGALSRDDSASGGEDSSELCRNILKSLATRLERANDRLWQHSPEGGFSWAEPILDQSGTVAAILTLSCSDRGALGNAPEAAVSDLLSSIQSLVVAASTVRGWRESAERLESISSALPGVVYQRVVKPDGDIRYTYITKAAHKIFGVEAERILADPEALFERHGPEYKARFRERLLSASEKLTPWDVQATIVTEDGSNRFTHAVATPVRQADGSVVWTGLIVDETETRKAIIESLPQGILLFDRDDKLLLRNAAFVEMHPSLAGVAVAGANYTEIIAAEVEAASQGRNADTLDLQRRLENHATVGSMFEQRSGNDRWLLINEHRTDEGGTVVIHTDITELKRRERRIQQLAYYDTLTGVANRALLDQRLLEALHLAEEAGSHVAVMCLDADKFKQVNDHFGHSGGDALLKAIAERLVGCLRDDATVGRLGGDEFAIVIPGMDDPKYCASVANRILQAVNQAVDFMGQSIRCGISIGIASYPSDGSSPEKLLTNADLALYRAKADGRGNFRFFSAEMDAEAELRRTIEVDLKQAIDRGQLAVHYQPQINVGTNEVVGFEALVRWFHPERGQIPPSDFIPIAEETGFIKTLGSWVLGTACVDACAWPDHVKVAVNVSPVQFTGDGLFEVISEALGSSGLNPERLEIEITESALLRNVDATLETLGKIKSLGVAVSMDDFGTGYSSLGNLRSFPFDKIKIDRSFVMDLERNPDSAAIVASIIGLGRNLGITTCAEGVERIEQLDCLKSEGCKEVQGFYYSKPQPVSAIAAMFSNRRGEALAASDIGTGQQRGSEKGNRDEVSNRLATLGLTAVQPKMRLSQRVRGSLARSFLRRNGTPKG